MIGEPCLHTTAHESVGHSIILDETAYEHDGTGQNGRETHTHLIQDDTGKNEEENEHIQERFCTLHGTERGGIPASG